MGADDNDQVREMRAEIDLLEGLRELHAEHLANGGTREEWVAYMDAFVDEITPGGPDGR